MNTTPVPQTPIWLRLLRIVAIAAGAFTAYLTVYIVLYEESLIYFPEKGNVGASPGEDVYLTASDGVKIHGWYVTHPDARMTILYLHGNAGNIEMRRDFLEELRLLPANVLLIDYRGFGKSEGMPTEQGVYRDARAAWDWLIARTPPDRIVIFGKSLGGALATDLASQVPAGALVVQSTFTRAADMAARVFPFFPMGRYMIRSKFDSLDKVARIRCPKLFIHTEDDEMIPFSMAQRLHEAAAPPKEFAWFKTGGHNALWVMEPKGYFARWRAFLEKLA